MGSIYLIVFTVHVFQPPWFKLFHSFLCNLNGIFYFSISSLLVHRNAIALCMLILYPITLLSHQF